MPFNVNYYNDNVLGGGPAAENKRVTGVKKGAMSLNGVCYGPLFFYFILFHLPFYSTPSSPTYTQVGDGSGKGE